MEEASILIEDRTDDLVTWVTRCAVRISTVLIVVIIEVANGLVNACHRLSARLQLRSVIPQAEVYLVWQVLLTEDIGHMPVTQQDLIKAVFKKTTLLLGEVHEVGHYIEGMHVRRDKLLWTEACNLLFMDRFKRFYDLLADLCVCKERDEILTVLHLGVERLSL